MITKNCEKKEPKKWAKPCISIETAKVIKRIAIDRDMYYYQVVDDVFKKNFPEYYKQPSEKQ